MARIPSALMLPCEMAVGFAPCLFMVRVTVSQVTVKSFVTSTIEAGDASTIYMDKMLFTAVKVNAADLYVTYVLGDSPGRSRGPSVSASVLIYCYSDSRGQQAPQMEEQRRARAFQTLSLLTPE